MTKCKFACMLGSIPNPLNAFCGYIKVCKDFNNGCGSGKEKSRNRADTEPHCGRHRTHTHSAFSEYHSQGQNTI